MRAGINSLFFDTNMGWGFRVIFSFYTLLEQMALLWLFLAILFGTFSFKNWHKVWTILEHISQEVQA